MKKRVLLMYISENSGHHHASRSIEGALHELSDDVETFNIDSFNYTNPILAKLVNQAYMSIIKRKPEFWGHIYDNPKIVANTQRLRDLIHKYTSSKMNNLLEELKPDAVICTQAFPCGIVADHKKTNNSNIFLAGVLTDYAPHSYWMYESVDAYFVPSQETKDRLAANGILEERIKISGIPINTKFRKITNRKKLLDSHGLSHSEPVILIMGGSQGIGPIKDVLKALQRSKTSFQTIVVAGTNKKLYKYLQKFAPRFNKKIRVLGYADNINDLMSISSIIITKPGGITISEALAKGLVPFIIKPIPGQEQMNSDHLVKYKVAVKINSVNDIDILLKELLSNPGALKNMQERARAFARPNSASDIAGSILDRIM